LKKIKVGAVSYLNTKPLLYGIERSAALMQQIELVTDYPSKIARQLLNDEIDIGLVPVAVIPQMKEYFIVSDYCIGSDGNVASVCLFSEVEINKIEKVLLDYQSKTSVALCKVLMKNHWKKNVLFEDAKGDFAKDIKENTAAVLIGDRALKQRTTSNYNYDLGGAWKVMTGLPFVFAAWISNKKLSEDFIKLFNQKNAEGINNIGAVIKENKCNVYDLHTYYTQNISYTLNSEKLKGMNLFLELMQQPI
jgi:chorismate dehydratase